MTAIQPSENGTPIGKPRAKGFFKQVKNRIASFFGSAKENGSSPAITMPAVEEEGAMQYEELSELHKSLDANNPQLSNELRQCINRSVDFFWKHGKKDGSIGQKHMGEDIFKMHALQIKDEVSASLKSQLVTYDVEHDTLKKKNKDKESVKQEAEHYRNEIYTRKELYPRSFSLKLAIFYIVLALLLILADIPLALKLTQYGFNLHTAEGTYSVDNLFLWYKGENFLGHAWLVFANNWEVFVLAFGIALCTVYVKIFYDDFMGYPVDKAVRQFKILKRLASTSQEGGDFTENDMKAIKRKFRTRIGVKAFFLFLTLGTIVLLGLFRAENLKRSQNDAISPLEMEVL